MHPSEGSRCGTNWPARVVTKPGRAPSHMPRPAPPPPSRRALAEIRKGGPLGQHKKPLPHLCILVIQWARRAKRESGPGCLSLRFEENYAGGVWHRVQVQKGCSVDIIITCSPLLGLTKRRKLGEGGGTEVILNSSYVANVALLIPLEISSLHSPPLPL